MNMVRCIPFYYVILKMIASSLCGNHFPLPLSAKVITLANVPIIRDELYEDGYEDGVMCFGIKTLF